MTSPKLITDYYYYYFNKLFKLLNTEYLLNLQIG